MLLPYINDRIKTFLLGLMLVLTVSCSHKYNSNEMDLGFYQWNMWPDNHATENGSPSCGWNVLHRGMGELVRIPAMVEDHFPAEELSGITWFHCRFTLPELWEHREITLKFDGISHPAEVYLNELLVGSTPEVGSAFEIDVTKTIYYVRDNHLTLRISDPEKISGGMTGTLRVISVKPGQESEQND